MALITGEIPQSNYEAIRERLALVLATELDHQDYIATSELFIKPEIWIGRTVPFDKSEMPALNIMYGSTDFSGDNARNSVSENQYYIDLYYLGKSSDTEDGDELAESRVMRAAATVWAILRNPQYDTLQFSKPSLSRTTVGRIETAQIATQDATNIRFGRVIYTATANEETELKTAETWGQNTTRYKIEQTDKGYKVVTT